MVAINVSLEFTKRSGIVSGTHNNVNSQFAPSLAFNIKSFLMDILKWKINEKVITDFLGIFTLN